MTARHDKPYLRYGEWWYDRANPTSGESRPSGPFESREEAQRAMTDEIRVVIDRDCPDCGWAEMVAIGTTVDGPQRIACPKCRFDVSAATWNRLVPEGVSPDGPETRSLPTGFADNTDYV